MISVQVNTIAEFADLVVLSIAKDYDICTDSRIEEMPFVILEPLALTYIAGIQVGLCTDKFKLLYILKIYRNEFIQILMTRYIPDSLYWKPANESLY